MTARLVVAGTHSGVGKTTVATGLMAALAARGLTVAGFKIGPDFIDPSYHQLATGRPARNLDGFLSGADLVAPLFVHGAAGADIAVVEGVMGLFDGVSGRGELASTAHVAKLLSAPVVLVVDAGAMGRSVAALVHGYASFDPAVRVAGVICNRVGSDGHETLLREALQPLRVPVLGIVRRDPGLATPSRHLGLVPVAERAAEARRAVADLARNLAAAVDLEAVVALARSAPPLRSPAWVPPKTRTEPARVAVAGGPAFSFGYAENLELLQAAGAELVALDPTRDPALPDVDALYLGGGFPEAHADALGANVTLRTAVAGFAAAGRPILAECGGLLYLCRSLDGKPMCGVLEANAVMTDRLTLGYRRATVVTASAAWQPGAQVRGHEFHYSTVEPAAGATPAWQLVGSAPTRDARGAALTRGRLEGFVAGGLHASYLHTHWAGTPQVAAGFVAAAARARVHQ